LNTSEQLIIPYKGLADGKHELEFNVSDKFFQSLDYSEFNSGNVTIYIGLDKKPSHLVLEIEIEGKVGVICDRCLDTFDAEVEFSGVLYIKFSGNDDSESESNEELLVLSPDDFEVDLTHYLYESICLGVPSVRVHPLNSKGKSACNKEMIKIIKEHSGGQASKIVEIDPRWEKLKNLNNN
jgi:uncharacterized protein